MTPKQRAEGQLLTGYFELCGTDGCSSCESGRVSLFVANKQCIECDPEGYKKQPAIKEKKIEMPSEKCFFNAYGFHVAFESQHELLRWAYKWMRDEIEKRNGGGK